MNFVSYGRRKETHPNDFLSIRAVRPVDEMRHNRDFARTLPETTPDPETPGLRRRICHPLSPSQTTGRPG